MEVEIFHKRRSRGGLHFLNSHELRTVLRNRASSGEYARPKRSLRPRPRSDAAKQAMQATQIEAEDIYHAVSLHLPIVRAASVPLAHANPLVPHHTIAPSSHTRWW